MEEPMLRKPIALSLLAAAATLTATAAIADLKLPRVSPSATLTQTVGLTDLTVAYSRPGVKNRVIWGGLVPYDTLWRTGANEATTFTTTDPIQFGGKPLAAGGYALFTVPGKDEWTVIVNSEKSQNGAFNYHQDKDVMRLTVKPTEAEPQEWMQFTFEDLTPTSANLVLRWEKLRLAVPIVVDANGKALAAARDAVAKLKSDDWRTPMQAANFCLTNEVAMDEGQKWLEKSLSIQTNYNNLSLQARWQMKQGRKDDAIKSAQKALAAAKTSKDKVDTSATEKLLADWTAK
jgi:hypothetical protein